MKIKPIAITLCIIAVLALLLFPKILSAVKGKPKGPGGAAGAPTAPIEAPITLVTYANFKEPLNLPGMLVATYEVEVKAEISGVIKTVQFADGQYVHEGQTLALIDDTEWRLQMEAKAIQKEQASKEEARLAVLLKQQGVSQNEYEAAEYKLRLLENEWLQLKTKVEKCTLKAPFAGKVGIRMVSPGAVISPTQAITTLTSAQTVLEFSMPERYGSRIKIGAEVPFISEYAGKDTLKAILLMVSPTVDPATRTFLVRGKVIGAQVPAGASARVIFNSDIEDKVALLPNEALYAGAGGYKVFVLKGGVAAEKTVLLLTRTENLAVISEGIAEGDSVITGSLLKIKVGTPIKVTEVSR